MDINGSLCAIATPFHADGALDLPAFGRLIDHQLDGGTQGVVVAGSTGEAHMLDEHEYERLLAFAVERIAHRVPVIAGTGEAATSKTIALTKRAGALGADAALVVTPYYVRPTQDGLRRHFGEVAARGGLPVVMYNVPSRTGCDMQPETVAALRDTAGIIGIKEAVGKPDRIAAMAQLQRPGFVYLSGDDGSAADSMLAGAGGVVSVVNNLVPKLFRDLCDAARGGDRCSVSDGKQIILGSDDGRVISVNASGETQTLATDARRRWIDNVAVHSDGSIAYSAGKTAFVKQPKGAEKSLDVPSTVGGLAFAPKGFRLAIAHYNGVTMWFPNMAGSGEFLEWKGSHLGVMFSPDGKFMITAMHEAALHGWRLVDAKHMRMTGYPGRVRSMAWTTGGKALATSGADCIILWPFASKDGPMGKEPAMLAPLPTKVSVVACHPSADVLAAGYADGTVLMVRMEDGAEILVRRKDDVPVAGLAWSADGKHLALATEAGEAGLLTL